MTNIILSAFSAFTVLYGGCGQANHSFEQNIISADTIKINVGKAPGCVELADLNHDKITDIIVTSEIDNNVTILFGLGKGLFKEAAKSPFAAGDNVNDVVSGDFNNDDNPDLAFANHERKYLTVLLGDGKENFIPAPKSPFPVDGTPHTHGIATGDFDNDGRLDLVTDSWGNDQVEILWGDSANLFKTPGIFFKVGKRPYQRVRAFDVNADGIDDIVTTNTEGNNVTVLLGNGKGGFYESTGSPFACGDSPFSIAIGDINADGRVDLAIINSPGSMAEGKGENGLTVLLGDGTGKFITMNGSPFEAGKIPNGVSIGDINGDGVKDIVTSDNSSNKIYLFLMRKNSSVLSSSSLVVGNHPKGVAIADLNGDGKGDIVVCNNSDNTITIIL